MQPTANSLSPFDSFGNYSSGARKAPLDALGEPLGPLVVSVPDKPASPLPLVSRPPANQTAQLKNADQFTQRQVPYVLPTTNGSYANTNANTVIGTPAVVPSNGGYRSDASVRPGYKPDSNEGYYFYSTNSYPSVNDTAAVGPDRTQILDSYNRKRDELGNFSRENDDLRNQLSTLRSTRRHQNNSPNSSFRYKGSSMQSSIKTLLAEQPVAVVSTPAYMSSKGRSETQYPSSYAAVENNSRSLEDLSRQMREFQSHLNSQDVEIRKLTSELDRISVLLAAEKEENRRLKSEIARLKEENTALMRGSRSPDRYESRTQSDNFFDARPQLRQSYSSGVGSGNHASAIPSARPEIGLFDF